MKPLAAAVEAFEHYRRHGVEFVSHDGQLHFRPVDALQGPELERLRALKAELAVVSEYYQWVTFAFELARRGASADPGAAHLAAQETVRLVDDIGAGLALRLRRVWAREWATRSGVCPWCGEAGAFHDNRRGGF